MGGMYCFYPINVCMKMHKKMLKDGPYSLLERKKLEHNNSLLFRVHILCI